MKLEIKEYQVKTVEIELPVYRKAICHYYKVYSDENCIQVCDLEDHLRVGVCSSKLAFSDENIKDCSKEEFEENFKRVSETIISLIQ
jgi:hypothetical protein